MPQTLPLLKQETRQEYFNILSYWQKYGIDKENGGFYGQVNDQNIANPQADKSLVLNARILWTYSIAYRHFPQNDYLGLAKRAYDYIFKYFRDIKEGGVYWSVKFDGSPSEQKKQIYAHSFAIYSLSEYFNATHQQEALDFAIDLFNTVERYSFDAKNGGYIEAFARDWSATDDYILSKGDLKKSMNTHLHLLEAYTNLYRVWKNPGLYKQLAGMTDMFIKHIIDPKTYRMRLFFDENWVIKSREISYGHDIEASWLLWETAEVLKNKALSNKIKQISIEMVKAATGGLDPDGGMNNDFDPEKNHLNEQKDWWVQAEAMVGFFNAYQLTGKVHFLQKSFASWEFIKQFVIDHTNGEWFWGANPDHTPIKKDKINAWKCPYHNSRACWEIFSRIK